MTLSPSRLRIALPVLLVAAHWPVVRWMAVCVRHSANDASEVTALILATALMFLMRKPLPKDANLARLLLPATLGTLVYALLYPWLLDEIQGVLLATTGALLIAPLWLGKRYSVGLHGLLLLAQPLIPVFQFQLGYPLRALCAKLSASLLQLGQLDVTANGTALEWAGRSVYVDAPCSGIRMLWSGMLLVFALAMILDLSARRTLLLSALGFLGILLANAFRAAALFYFEAGILDAPPWAHSAVGLVAFALVGLALVAITLKLARSTTTPKKREPQPCAV